MMEYWNGGIMFDPHGPLAVSVIIPLFHSSNIPLSYSFNTSHINVMIAVATMIDTMLVTTAEVAA
jgi:hypothetical protein